MMLWNNRNRCLYFWLETVNWKEIWQRQKGITDRCSGKRQAVKNILPNFGNEFTNLIQASSQVMVIGVAELMFTFNTISSNGRVFTPLIVIAFLYFVMTFTVGRGVHAMEKHFKKADR